jgi:hypothetical protein
MEVVLNKIQVRRKGKEVFGYLWIGKQGLQWNAKRRKHGKDNPLQ